MENQLMWMIKPALRCLLMVLIAFSGLLACKESNSPASSELHATADKSKCTTDACRLCIDYQGGVSCYQRNANPSEGGSNGAIATRGTPNAAFLAMIGFAEGTNDRYNILFGGSTFFVGASGYDDHPRRVICLGICSSAAGRYQFLNVTWDNVRPRIGATNFGPAHQDEGALLLIRGRGVASVSQTLSRTAFAANIYKLAPEWASLPTQSGSSYYGGQSARSMNQLFTFYQSRL
jgi:muramidase (phage lysozyme)